MRRLERRIERRIQAAEWLRDAEERDMARRSRFETPARIPTTRDQIADIRLKIAELERQVGSVGPSLSGSYWHTSRVRELESCRKCLARLEERAEQERREAASNRRA